MRNLVATLLLVLLAWGCDEGQIPTGPSAEAGVRISGRVLDFGTDIGVSGAAVHFGDTPAMTDVSGSYVMFVPSIDFYSISVDGAVVGRGLVTGRPTYRGDLLVHGGTCISRYGALTDAGRLQPVAGATVSLAGRSTTSAADGWYRIDLGCPEINRGGNTTLMTVEHPRYVTRSVGIGRGVFGVRRIDVDLVRR